MHIDGLLEVQMVDGFTIKLDKTDDKSKTITISHRLRELAPKSATNNGSNV